MAFNSLTFLIFLSSVFAVYWGLNGRLRLQNLFLLVVSYVFYGWWDWRFLLLMALSSAIDFLAGLRLGSEQGPKKRKMWLTVSVVANLGLLGFFKYFNFFIESAKVLLTSIGLPTSIESLNIILPVGISFYTFQTLSYTIDVYRKQLTPTRSLAEFFAFVSFFPQLVAGPIERASHLLPQFERERKFDRKLATNGMRLILWGLFKKMVIADRVAIIVEQLYADPAGCDSIMALMAGALFAYQVYCDFSGYSDIAIGAGRLLGFELTRNFITPFLSTSMTEFWQRWHLSLSTWFRDYLYIPLGGSHGSRGRIVLNLFIIFAVSGLWHGADFHYVLWGVMCSIPLIIERLFGIRKIGQPATFLVFCLLLIMFRSSGVSSALDMYGQILAFQFNGASSIESLDLNVWETAYTFSFLLVFVIAESILGKVDFDESISKLKSVWRWTVYYAILLAIVLFGVMDNAPQFIYFQF